MDDRAIDGKVRARTLITSMKDYRISAGKTIWFMMRNLRKKEKIVRSILFTSIVEAARKISYARIYAAQKTARKSYFDVN